MNVIVPLAMHANTEFGINFVHIEKKEEEEEAEPEPEEEASTDA
jgi:hypothetical protein